MGENNAVRIGIIDSGVADEILPSIKLSQRFSLDPSRKIQCGAIQPDSLGHGSAVSRILQRYAPYAQLYVAQVFDATGHTSARQIAAALDWLRNEQVQLVCLSLGVRAEHDTLTQAVTQTLNTQMLLCASTPARGEPVYPAAYSGVVRVTGDARCAPHEWSWLGTKQADFGAAVRQQEGQPAGASMANAALCAHLAALWHTHPHLNKDQLLSLLRKLTPIQGPQTRPVLINPA